MDFMIRYEFTSSVTNLRIAKNTRISYNRYRITIWFFLFHFEESVTEYISHINQYNIKENLLSLKGAPTGSSNSLTHKRVNPSFLKLYFYQNNMERKDGVGGRVDYKKGRIDVVSGSQEYDLNKVWGEKSESGN